MKSSCITGGHAEIEDETILFIYGNSYDVVLTNQSFQETVEKIRFEYIFIEFLIEQNILSTLKKFKYAAPYVGSSRSSSSGSATSCRCCRSPSWRTCRT